MNYRTPWFVVVLFLFSGCALHCGLISRKNVHSTQAALYEKDFEIAETAQVKALATYISGIDGLERQVLASEARANMLS